MRWCCFKPSTVSIIHSYSTWSFCNSWWMSLLFVLFDTSKIMQVFVYFWSVGAIFDDKKLQLQFQNRSAPLPKLCLVQMSVNLMIWWWTMPRTVQASWNLVIWGWTNLVIMREIKEHCYAWTPKSVDFSLNSTSGQAILRVCSSLVFVCEEKTALVQLLRLNIHNFLPLIGSGAWLVAHKAEQRRRFKAVLCTKPRDYQQIREERKKSEKDGTAIVPPPSGFVEDDEEDDEGKILDGFFLVRLIRLESLPCFLMGSVLEMISCSYWYENVNTLE